MTGAAKSSSSSVSSSSSSNGAARPASELAPERVLAHIQTAPATGLGNGDAPAARARPVATPTAGVDNPMPHLLPEGGDNATPLEVTLGSAASDKLIIVMVGLPATGKTHIAKRICRFLSFFHDIPSEIFNAGDYRRKLHGAKQSAEFYAPENEEGAKARKMAVDAALGDLIEYMAKDGVRVGALDATNSTRERRQYIVDSFKARGVKSKWIFLESICDQQELLEENIRKVKLSTPDYQGMDPEKAVKDFKKRRENYLAGYEPVDDSDGPHIKIINSCQFIVNKIRGYLPLKVVHFVMNLHTLPRTFYLTRHGQSEYNLLGKIGGDSGLSPAGLEYARRLAKFAKDRIVTSSARSARLARTSSALQKNGTLSMEDLLEDEEENDDDVDGVVEDDIIISDDSKDDDDNKNKDQTAPSTSTSTSTALLKNARSSQAMNGHLYRHHPKEQPCRLWTSTLRRTKETAQFIEHNKIQFTWDNGDSGEWVQFRPMTRRNLDELYAGVCDGMTYKEIEEVYPEEFARRQADKMRYRYPRGESYMDVTLRLEPLAQELERTREPVLIIAHQGILRILYAYFMGLDRAEAPYVSIPLNNVIELTPHAYGCHEQKFCLMNKEEMLVDGQDEPITSMPVAGKKQKQKQRADPYSPSDPIMNAPSC